MQTDLDILDTDVVELEVPGSASLIKRAEWGHIVGDISNQEDLNSILNTKPSREEIDDILTNYRTSEEQDIIDNSKAKDIEVVHTFKDEVINGKKTFNSDIHFNSKVSVGGSIAGTKAFKITKVSQDKKTFTFENTNGIELDFEGNIYIYDGNTDTNYMFFGNVSVIDGNDISFDKEIPWEGGLDLVNSYIWFTGHPEIGDISIGLYAFAEGYNTMANQIGGHSEGINTISAGKYGHAEGLGTLAGYAAHAQGRDTKARGLYSDASGRASEANGDYSIAGIQGKANAANSISVGTSTETKAKYAIATGHGTIANKEDQIVCGKYNDHTSDALFMIGDGRSNENRHNAFEVHNDSIKINGSILSKEKVNKIDEIPLNIKDAEGNRSVVSGYQNEAPAACAFAGGATSKANHDYSLAYGVRLETGKQDQVVFGRDNEVSNDALLVIGAGTSSKKANAFEVRNNSIKIGKSILEAPNKSGVFAITDDVDSCGHRIELVLDEETYQLRCELIDKNGNLISTSSIIDLPIERLVTGGYYDSIRKIIVLELEDGRTIDIPVSDLVSDLQEKITSSNKLSSDLIDDISSTNKFVTENDKNNWNNKANNIKDGAGLNSLAQKTNAGVENTASGAYSSAIGRMNSATANYSFAGGNESNADVQGSFVYGQGVRTSPGAGYNQIVLGRYNADNKDAIFILGKGNSTDRKNAFEILQNGIKIGNNLLLENDIPVLEKNTNKVTSIDSESTDTQYPSAKAVYDELNNKVDKVSGKGLSTNDFTNADKTKLDDIENGAEVNVIDDIKVDNVSLTPTNKSVNIDLSSKENVSNKTTSLSSASTDTQYPSAKCVYDNIPTNVSQLNNDSGFITNAVDNLTNYRTSSAQDTIDSNKQSKITSSNKLSSDLVDDANHTNKFVSATDISNWNNKVSDVKINNVSVVSSGVASLTIDNTLSNSSENAVQNKVVKGALDSKQNEITSSNKLNSDLITDTNQNNKFVSAQEKQDWNSKSDFSGNYNDLINKPTIPTNVSQLNNDSGYLTLGTLPIYNGGIQ